VCSSDLKGREVAEVTGLNNQDHKSYCNMLDRVAGSISFKKHPEWSTSKKVEKWLRETRLKSERKF
jgi:hypothetical protein